MLVVRVASCELRVDMRVANNFAFRSQIKFIFGTFVR